MITAAQLRGARGLLGWSQSDLAERASVSLSTIKRMEASAGLIRGVGENIWSVQRALEQAGIVFIDEDGGGRGVRLRAPDGR